LEVPGCGVGALAGAAGERVRVEVAFEDRLQYVHDGVMQYAIPVRRGGDEPPLRAGNPVGDERAGGKGAS